jgi:hypothetical protein
MYLPERREKPKPRLCKKRMWLEIRAKVHLESHELRRVVLVFFTAFVTTNDQTDIDLRRRREGVRLSQRNLVTAEKILVAVKFVVLADDNPTVRFFLTPGIPGSHEMSLNLTMHKYQGSGGLARRRDVRTFAGRYVSFVGQVK